MPPNATGCTVCSPVEMVIMQIILILQLLFNFLDFEQASVEICPIISTVIIEQMVRRLLQFAIARN